MLDPAARAHLAALPPRDAHKKASQYCHTAYICIFRLREHNVNDSFNFLILSIHTTKYNRIAYVFSYDLHISFKTFLTSEDDDNDRGSTDLFITLRTKKNL